MLPADSLVIFINENFDQGNSFFVTYYVLNAILYLEWSLNISGVKRKTDLFPH